MKNTALKYAVNMIFHCELSVFFFATRILTHNRISVYSCDEMYLSILLYSEYVPTIERSQFVDFYN